MTYDTQARILALEVRHRRIGFALIEAPRLLLDFGAKKYRSPSHAVKILATLVTTFVPCTIVAKRADHKDGHHRRNVTAALQSIRMESARRAVPMEILDVHEVRCVFRRSGRTKEDIAAAVAQAFPELHWKLPPTRHKRSWVNEGWNMAIFDAVATGLAYLARADEDKNSVTRTEP